MPHSQVGGIQDRGHEKARLVIGHKRDILQIPGNIKVRNTYIRIILDIAPVRERVSEQTIVNLKGPKLTN